MIPSLLPCGQAMIAAPRATHAADAVLQIGGEAGSGDTLTNRGDKADGDTHDAFPLLLQRMMPDERGAAIIPAGQNAIAAISQSDGKSALPAEDTGPRDSAAEDNAPTKTGTQLPADGKDLPRHAMPAVPALQPVDQPVVERGTAERWPVTEPSKPSEIAGETRKTSTGQSFADEGTREKPPEISRSGDLRVLPAANNSAASVSTNVLPNHASSASPVKNPKGAQTPPPNSAEPPPVEANVTVRPTGKSEARATAALAAPVTVAASPEAETGQVPTAGAGSSVSPSPNPSTPANGVFSAISPSVPAAQAGDAMTQSRPMPQIETAIENIASARESGRAGRSDIVLRHGEFGNVAIRLEAHGTDLRATLTARDPAFVPAIQAALSDRSAMPGDAAPQLSSRQSDQGSAGQTPGQNGGGQTANGSGSDQRYGSSPGSGQGSSQPYGEHQEPGGAEHVAHDKPQTLNDRSGGLFA